ncbi:MAG: parallel beta-helix repeat protein, partial [Ilumatobacter sp.]
SPALYAAGRKLSMFSVPRLHPHLPRRRVAGSMIALGVLAMGLSVIGGEVADAEDVIHVSPSGSDKASGDGNDPVQTVARAVKMASPGDTVVLASGTYHETVQVYAKEVHITAAPGADAVFDGARQVGGWTPRSGAWTAPWSTDFERSGAPFTLAERPEAGWPEQFWVAGVELTEARNRSDLGPGFFYYDRAADLVWIDDDPRGQLVEGSALMSALYLNGADGSSISNVTVRRYATPTRGMAAVRAYANNLVLTDVTVEDNAFVGVSMMGNNISIDGMVTRRNGHLGVHAHLSKGITITDSVIEANNAKGFDGFHSAGGFKVTESSNIEVSHTRVSGNNGPGLWTDLGTVDIELIGNWVDGNTRSGIEIELSSRAVIAGNTVVNNGETGVWVLESGDVDVWHNALFDNYRDVWVEEGPRSDVRRVAVVNNTMGGSSGAPAILNVDDWTEERSAKQMNVELRSNRYWLPAGSPTLNISRWANWPRPIALSPTIGEHISATSGDQNASVSRTSSNPYIRSASDTRPPSGSSLGVAVTSSIAEALGLNGGQVFPAGPVQPFGAAGGR